MIQICAWPLTGEVSSYLLQTDTISANVYRHRSPVLKGHTLASVRPLRSPFIKRCTLCGSLPVQLRRWCVSFHQLAVVGIFAFTSLK